MENSYEQNVDFFNKYLDDVIGTFHRSSLIAFCIPDVYSSSSNGKYSPPPSSSYLPLPPSEWLP